MKVQNRQEGRIIIVVLITVFTLSAFWFIALSSTGKELKMVGGKKSDAQQFLDAEAGLSLAMDDFGALANSLSGPIYNSVTSKTFTDPTSAILPADQSDLAVVTLRPIQNLQPVTARDHGQPAQRHESTPPAGSSSGVNSTVTRRYSINSASVVGDREVQAGVYRIVPKE